MTKGWKGLKLWIGAVALLLILWLPATQLLKRHSADPPALLSAWSYSHTDKLSPLLLQGDAGHVLATGEDGQLICLSSETGKHHFSVHMPPGFEQAVSLQVDMRGNFYIADRNGRVMAVDRAGELLWSFEPRPAEAVEKVPPGAASAVCFAISGAAFYGLAEDGSLCWALLNPDRSLLNFNNSMVSRNMLYHLRKDGSVARIDALGQIVNEPFGAEAGFAGAGISQLVVADSSMLMGYTESRLASKVDFQLHSATAGAGELSGLSRIDYVLNLGAGSFVLGESNSSSGLDDEIVLCDFRLRKLKSLSLGLEHFIFSNGDYILYCLPSDSGSHRIEAWSEDGGALWQRSAPAGLEHSDSWQAARTGGMLVTRGSELSLLRMNRAE